MSRPANTRKPHRRPHKKSRNGCNECRRRRVKCDEGQPNCSRCIDRDIACEYPRRAHRCPSSSGSLPEATSAIEPSTQRRQVAALPLCSTGHSISRELEVMHYWCTRTCHSFTPHLAELFRDQIGRESLRHEFLMNALLALTSFHIASETENTMDAHSYLNAAFQYYDQAVSGLREVLPNVASSTCVAIFASSAMIAACAIVSPLLHTSPDDEVKSIAEVILAVIDVLRGTSSIIEVSRQWLLQGPLSGILRGDMPRHASAMKNAFPTHELRQLNDALLIRSNYEREERESALGKHEIFEDAVQKLEKAIENEVSMLPWLVKVDSRFMDELWKGEPMAGAIFMHWSVFLNQLDDM